MEPVHLLEVQGLIIGCWNKEYDLDALIYYNLPKSTTIGFRFRVHQVSTAPHSPITRLRPRPRQVVLGESKGSSKEWKRQWTLLWF